VSMEELSHVLWRERELLEMLAFKLEEEELVLAHGRSRWLAYASREVQTVLDTIQRTEVLRALTADTVAAAIGVQSNPSLLALAECSDEPWRTILLEHRDELVALVAQITEMAAASRELLTAGYDRTRETVLARSAAAQTPSREVPGVVVDAAVDLQLQEVVYRAALATTERVLQPTLLDFLR
jgi:FlgN protein